MLPLIPIAAGGALLYLLLTGDKKASAATAPKKSTVTKVAGGKVTTSIPTVDGRGYKLTTTPKLLAAIMAMSKTNDAGKMTVMAAQFMREGKVNEAIACNHLAAVIATHQATGGKAVSPKAAKASTEAAAKPPQVVAATNPPLALVNELTKAIAAGSTPDDLRALADRFDDAGFPAQAASIRAAADEAEAALKESSTPKAAPQAAPKVAKKTPGFATAPVFTPKKAAPAAPRPKTPALPKPKKAKKLSARRLAADALVRELGARRPPYGQENRALTAAYQDTLGVTGDGKYGPGTAKTLAEPASGAHVPPPPRTWPAGVTGTMPKYISAANDYDKWLMAQKSADKARAGEWQAAYLHARDFWPSGSRPQPRKG